jgi:hypothetical protein
VRAGSQRTQRARPMIPSVFVVAWPERDLTIIVSALALDRAYRYVTSLTKVVRLKLGMHYSLPWLCAFNSRVLTLCIHEAAEN